MRGLIVAGVCLVGMAGAMIANPAGVADLVRGKGYDFLQTVSPRAAPSIPDSRRPLLVDFDATSQTPNWLDLAVLVRRLDAAGAKAVIVPEPLDRPDPMSPEQVAAAWMDAGLGLELRDSLVQLTPHRQILAEAFGGKKVFGVFDTAGLPAAAVSDAALTVSVTNGLAGRLPASPGARGNLADLERAMSGLGDAALRPEPDNVVRTVPLATDVAGTPVASVLLRAVSADGPVFTLDERAVPDLPVTLPDLRQGLVFKAGKSGPVIPADAGGRYRLYRAETGKLPRVPAEAVLAGRVDPETVRGRIAIVGGMPLSAPEFNVGGGDRWSRAEILTNALDQIAAGQHVERLSWAHAGEAVAMVLAGLGILLLAALPGTALMVLFTLIAIAGMWTGALYGLSEYGLWFDAALPTSGLLVTALLALMFRPAGTARKGREKPEDAPKDRREPGLPLLVPSLRRSQPEGIQSTEGTLLVCRIRDVEKLEQAYAHSPDTLAGIFKAFRNMAASHIESQGGTVLPEAAVGAAGTVAAFWRMPKERSPAARQAADCALRLVSGLDEFNASLEESVSHGPELPELPELNVSIGIASGPVFLEAGGPGGVPERIFGPAVSAAERLEHSAADYGPAVIMGGKAADGLRNRYALLEVDLLALPTSGYEATAVFALLGNPLVRANPRFRTLDEAHRAIFQAYRERKWSVARALVDECRKLSMAVPGLYDLYERRITWFEQNPPEEGWSGAFTPPVR